jgi:hypothetical protein
MRDIVATIQPDQDELVRAELDESICVQGAPGTGNPNPGIWHTSYARNPAPSSVLIKVGLRRCRSRKSAR